MSAEHKVELLAPAGSPEGFYGAIHAGADAVYLAGTEYGARAYADNFSEEELLACIRYAHIWNRKVYLTVNTLVKEEESARLSAFLAPLVNAGLDGVIVQDPGAFQIIRSEFPSLPIHASTQMTVTGAYGAKMLGKLGAVRVVPARELSLKEIVQLKQESGLEVECFIHGAMCYCYSGQCLFSSILGGRSGNRGRCAQPCRLPYKTEATGNREVYPLSLKDMCTLEILPELIEAGIDSFKIEGRMKKPEYAAGVTALYRKYIDLYYAGKNCRPSKEDLGVLSRLYIRSEIHDGYYHKRNGAEMITLSSPAYSGSDDQLLSSIRSRYLESRPQIAVQMHVILKTDQPAEVWIRTKHSEGSWVKVQGAPAEPASKAPLTKESVLKQISKLGDTSFVMENTVGSDSDITMEIGDSVFYSVKSLNELRRQAVNLLEEVLIHA